MEKRARSVICSGGHTVCCCAAIAQNFETSTNPVALDPTDASTPLRRRSLVSLLHG